MILDLEFRPGLHGYAGAIARDRHHVGFLLLHARNGELLAGVGGGKTARVIVESASGKPGRLGLGQAVRIAFDHIDRLEIPGGMLEGRGYDLVLRLPSIDVGGKIQRIRIHLDEIRRGIAGNDRAVRIGIGKAVKEPFFLEQAADEIEVALAVLDGILADRAG